MHNNIQNCSLTFEKQRIYYWDNIKGFLIIMVVIGHLIELYMNDFKIVDNIWSLIYSFHMPAFIFISGHFMSKTSKPIHVNCAKMLKIYLLMQILFQLFYLISEPNIKFSVRFSPQPTIWYILFMIYGYILTALMKDVDKKIWIPAVFVIGLLAGFDNSIGLAMSLSRLMYFLPFLSLGYYLEADSLVEKLKSKWYIFIPVFILMQCLIWKITDKSFFNREVFMGSMSYLNLFKNNVFLGFANRMFAYAAGILILACILALAPKQKTILSIIGKHTLVIYLVHSLTMKIVFKIMPDIHLFQSKKLNAIITLLIIAACIAVVSVLIICIQNYTKKIKQHKITAK